MRLRGKTTLITGGTSGIGLATAELFLREGARVAITGRDPERLAQARARLGGDVVTIAADVRKAADLRDMARQLAAAFGATGLERRSSNWRARPPSSWRTPNARWRGGFRPAAWARRTKSPKRCCSWPAMPRVTCWARKWWSMAVLRNFESWRFLMT